MLTHYKKGMTLFEIVVVLAILGILVTIALPQFREMRQNQVLKATLSEIVSALSKSRAQTLASVDSSEYGVHFESNQVIIFKGTSYDSSDPDNEVIDIASPASTTDITLGGISGSSGSIYFSRLYGVPNAAGTITVATPSFSAVVTISGTGVVSVN